MPEEETNGLERLSFLIGKWAGKGEGFGNTSQVETTFRYILQDKFIQSQTWSIAHDMDGNLVEEHEDMGVFSYDPDLDKIVFREFYTEGYVITYTMEEAAEPEHTLVFTSLRQEGTGGMRARQRMKVVSEDEFESVLDLAQGDGEFSACQTIWMRRKS